LKVTSFNIPLTCKGNFGALVTEKVLDLLVCDITYLKVLLHDFTVLVADAAFFGFHQGIAS
jgi:hypothetical protein